MIIKDIEYFKSQSHVGTIHLLDLFCIMHLQLCEAETLCLMHVLHSMAIVKFI